MVESTPCKRYVQSVVGPYGSKISMESASGAGACRSSRSPLHTPESGVDYCTDRMMSQIQPITSYITLELRNGARDRRHERRELLSEKAICCVRVFSIQ